jgi:membrane-associated phospholipid phosphatase
MGKTSESIAKIISYIFNPLLMPTLGILIIFHSGTYLSYMPFEGKKFLFTLIFAGTFVIPLCFLPFYFYFKVIQSVEMETQLQRIMPLLITCVLYFCTFYILRSMPVPFITMFVFSTCVSLLVNLLILLKWKVSSHLIGLGGITGLIASLHIRLNADITNFLILSILLSGLVGSSRLRLNSHTPSQVYLGFLIGFSIVVTFLMI